MAFEAVRPRHVVDTARAEAAPRGNRLRHFTAIGAAFVLVLIGGLATPYAAVELRAVPGYMTAFGAAMIVINLVLAAILFSRGAVECRRDVTALGTAYLFVAVIFVPLVASFPQGILPEPLIGTGTSAIWLWLYWHGGFGLAILRYAAIAGRPARPQAPVAAIIMGVVVTVALLTLSATVFLPYLPATYLDGHTLFGGVTGWLPLIVLLVLGLATWRVARLGAKAPEQLWLTVAMVAACFDVWLTYWGVSRYSVGWYLSKCGSLFTSLAVLIAVLHEINLLYSRVAAANTVLTGLASRDSMTGLTNRGGLDDVMAMEWRKSRRDGRPIALLMIDVDHFKRFNDRYGHPAGDACLRAVADALLGVTRRPGDVAARYGGEEFALLLPATDGPGAVDMALRVRAAVRALAVAHLGSPHGIVTVSIGLASMMAADGGDAAGLLAVADRALYRAKAGGRDTFRGDEDEAPAVYPAPLDAAAEAWPLDDDAGDASAGAAPGRSDPARNWWSPRPAFAAPGALGELQREVLEAVVAGQPVDQIAARLCQGVERLAAGVVCSVLLVDSFGRLRPLAAPGLPDGYVRSIDGLQIGPGTGSCGTAAYFGQAIESVDIATDPRWVLYKAQPLAAGLRACWSSPIKGRDGRVIGVLAFYYRTPRSPSALEHGIVEASVHLCALAIEHAAVWSRLEEANHRFDVALSNMAQGLCFFSKGRLIVANRRYSEIYDLPPDSIRPGTTLKQIVDLRVAVGSGPVMSGGDYLGWRNKVHASDQASDTVVELENGRIVAIHHQPLPNEEWVSTHEDITERHRAEAELRYVMQHDVLTGMPNRALFLERLQLALSLLSRGQRFCVICINIDQFKPLNDALGHAVGDQLLQLAGERLQACVREVDTAARFGGTEFAVLLHGLDRPESAGELAQRIITALSEPYDVDGRSITVGATAGIAVPPGDGTNPAKLLQSADTALYRAKLEARGSYRFFEAEMDLRLKARFTLETDLRQAVRAEAFEVFYQPLLNLASNTVSGFEALLRWRHPGRGMVSPGEFIPLMEETGLIVPLGDWVLQHACMEAAGWALPVKVAVNLSAVQFKQPGLVASVTRALAASGLPACRLELEITETVLLRDGADTLATLHALRGLGVSIAMDDFGTGYSSLSYLRSFPFDKIKIDQSFIRDISDCGESIAIIRAIVGLGRSMGMATTAEGVETLDQLEHLRREGCTEIQGYLLSRPLAADAVHGMLRGPGALADLMVAPAA